MPSTIVLCRCDYPFQDKRYGKGRRVANFTAKGEARCTVCSTPHRVADAPAVKKKSGTGGGGGAKWFIAVPPPEGWPGGAPERNGYRKIT